MPFIVPSDQARADFPEYKFIKGLTPSEQKAAFHVTDAAGSHLCLKIVAPSFELDRLGREVMALQVLSHANVVRLREYTNTSKNGVQRHYIVEEFVEGDDLSSRLSGGVQMARNDAATLFAALADGLSALRGKKIVHRDLKPTNVRVRLDGTPVIIDFGLCRHLELPDLTDTSQGAAIGTPAYFAPEQADPASTKRSIDHRTDLFAFGVMLFQALTGRHPFRTPGMNVSQLRQAICTSTDYLGMAEFAALPPQWQTFAGRLLEKVRAKRPQEAAQVAAILRKIGGV